MKNKSLLSRNLPNYLQLNFIKHELVSPILFYSCNFMPLDIRGLNNCFRKRLMMTVYLAAQPGKEAVSQNPNWQRSYGQQ